MKKRRKIKRKTGERSAEARRKAVQRILGVTDDGIFGKITEKAFYALAVEQDYEPDHGEHHVLASSFADPADIAAFKRCKTNGNSDAYCFKIGDNGIGVWGDKTNTDVPMCALPRDVWARYGDDARGRLVRVNTETRTVVCELRDTLPSQSHITNGAGIDLNPAACSELGLRPPVKYPVAWRWA